MPDTMTQTGVVLFTILASVALISGLRKTVKNREWSAGALIGGSLVILTFTFVQLLVTYADAWVMVTDVYRTVTYTMPEWGHSAVRITTAMMGVGALVLFLAGIRRRDAQINIPAVLLVLVLCVSMGSAVLHGDFPFRAFTLVQLFIVLACVIAPRGLSVQLGIATVCMVATIASGVALIAYQDFSVMECVAGHKCGVLGFNFRGVLDNENALALYLALALPFVYIAFGGWEGLVMSAFVTSLILLSGSRSGALAAILTFAVLVLVRPNIRLPRPTPVRSGLVSAGLLTAFVVGVFLPFAVQDQSALSGRAALWQLARQALTDPSTLVYGTGLFGWDHYRDAGLIDSSAVYSVHNQWLHVLFSTGLIGFVLFVGAIAVLLWQARNRYFTVMGCVLVPFFILAVTERPWPIDTADWLTWAVPAALLCYPVLRAKPLADNQIADEDHRQLVPATSSSGPRIEERS